MTGAERRQTALPHGLRERVLEASLLARTAGRPSPQAAEISPVQAFSRAADAFESVLGLLARQQWRTVVLRELDVQGLVGHLIGVEEIVQRALSGDPAVAGLEHVQATQAAADREAGRPPDATRRDWRREVDRTLDQVRSSASLAAPAAVFGVQLPCGALLVVRAFELWTHENDIRRALGLPPSVPDCSTLRLMTGLAADLLPVAAVRAGLDEPLKVRLVLTGPGGGAWDVGIGQARAGSGSLRIVTDAVGFCRLAANRVAPAELDVHVEGDVDRAEGLLTATAGLALD